MIDFDREQMKLEFGISIMAEAKDQMDYVDRVGFAMNIITKSEEE